MSMNDADVDDDYVVKLPSGDARVMSVEELDAALEAGTIHAGSPVLAPGTTTWTTLGVLAGLDESAAAVPPAPQSYPPPSSPHSISPMMLAGPEIDIAIALDDEASFAPRRRVGKIVGGVFAALAIVAVGFAIKSVVTQAIATRAGEAALAAQSPLPPPPAAMPVPAPSPSPVVDPAPPPPAPAVAAAPATASKAGAADKDKKKGGLPGAPSKAKKKK
jgi:hypothetical protein